MWRHREKMPCTRQGEELGRKQPHLDSRLLPSELWEKSISVAEATQSGILLWWPWQTNIMIVASSRNQSPSPWSSRRLLVEMLKDLRGVEPLRVQLPLCTRRVTRNTPGPETSRKETQENAVQPRQNCLTQHVALSTIPITTAAFNRGWFCSPGMVGNV